MSIRVKNCCGFFPLWNGLLIWGFFSLVILYLSALVTLYRIQDVMYGPIDFYGSNDFFFLFTSFVGIVLHFIFNIVLVAGLIKNSCCMLEVYNGYLIISMVLEGIVSGLYIPLAMVRLYRADFNESKIFLWTLLYCVAAVIALIDLLFKYYILVCVRSLISILGSKEEEYQSECTELIVHDNTKRRRRDVNLQVGGNDDFTGIVYDNTNKTIDDNLQPVGMSDVNVNDDSNIMEVGDNSQPVVNSDVTVHDHTKYCMEKDDNSQPSEVTVHDDAKFNIQKDDKS